MLNEIFRRKYQEKDILKSTLNQVTTLASKNLLRSDLYYEKLETYLTFADELGLKGGLVVESCFDLADTLDPYYHALDWQAKTNYWLQERNKYSSIFREFRTINMQLYPEYFAAILEGKKRCEGRAFDPFSPKLYADIRSGDEIIFNIDKEQDNWQDICDELGLNSKMIMRGYVGEIFYSPTVHGIYQYCACGEEFQPMIKGVSELLELQRAAVYYSFPNYLNRIHNYGFLGIEIQKPVLVTSKV